MASGGQHPVVILYEHALLGEGIAKYLRAQLGVEARVVSAFDLQAVTSALALGPAVVIFELTEPLNQVDLTTLAPHAVLIDVKHGRDARPGPLPSGSFLASSGCGCVLAGQGRVGRWSGV